MLACRKQHEDKVAAAQQNPTLLNLVLALSDTCYWAVPPSFQRQPGKKEKIYLFRFVTRSETIIYEVSQAGAQATERHQKCHSKPLLVPIFSFHYGENRVALVGKTHSFPVTIPGDVPL